MNFLELFNECLKVKYTHTENDGDFALVVKEGVLYIYFQWSNGKADWVNNFRFKPTKYIPIRPYKRMKDVWRCHRGFFTVWDSIRDVLEEKVVEALINNPKANSIICVGYSHGGPLAGMATEDMMYIYGDTFDIKGVGFGCPRFVWGKLPSEVHKRFKRFVPVRNIPDVVCAVPPWWLGYSYGSARVSIGSRGKYNAFDAHKADSYRAELEGLTFEDEHDESIDIEVE